jgi:hypothetical protein
LTSATVKSAPALSSVSCVCGVRKKNCFGLSLPMVPVTTRAAPRRS